MTWSSAIRGQTMKELGRKSARILLVGIQAGGLHVADQDRLLASSARGPSGSGPG